MIVNRGVMVASVLIAQSVRFAFGVAPVDESSRVLDFAQPRAQFEQALKARDTSGVLRFVDSETGTQTENGMRTGPVAFRREWRLDDPKSEFWQRALVVM